MSGKSMFVDSNIVFYLLSGDHTLSELLDNRPIYTSFITELELLRFRNLSSQEELWINEFLNSVTIIDINSEIKRLVVNLGQKYKIKLPDLIIAASAFYLNQPLLTADKQLTQIEEINIVRFER